MANLKLANDLYISDISNISDTHPLCLELTSLRNTVARFQDEAHATSIKLQRHSLDVSRAQDRVSVLERENEVLRKEVAVLRACAYPDTSPDFHPAVAQARQLTLSLRVLSDKLSQTEDGLLARTTELVHALAEAKKAKHAAEVAHALVTRMRRRDEAEMTKERELQRNLQMAEERLKMSDLAVKEYASLVRSLESRLNVATSATSPRAHGTSASTTTIFAVEENGSSNPRSSRSLSGASLAESFEEGKFGLRRLLSEFSEESERLHAEVERLQSELTKTNAQAEAQNLSMEEERLELARTKAELQKLKIDDNTATKMVARYMKFSQASTDSLQSALSSLKARHAATSDTLSTQLSFLTSQFHDAQTTVERLREALDELSGDYMKELYGRRREVALRVKLMNREENLMESLRRWILRGQEALKKVPETPAQECLSRMVCEAKNILLSNDGPFEAQDQLPSGSLARIVAAYTAAESLVKELHFETSRRLEVQRALTLGREEEPEYELEPEAAYKETEHRQTRESSTQSEAFSFSSVGIQVSVLVETRTPDSSPLAVPKGLSEVEAVSPEPSVARPHSSHVSSYTVTDALEGLSEHANVIPEATGTLNVENGDREPTILPPPAKDANAMPRSSIPGSPMSDSYQESQVNGASGDESKVKRTTDADAIMLPPEAASKINTKSASPATGMEDQKKVGMQPQVKGADASAVELPISLPYQGVKVMEGNPEDRKRVADSHFPATRPEDTLGTHIEDTVPTTSLEGERNWAAEAQGTNQDTPAQPAPEIVVADVDEQTQPLLLSVDHQPSTKYDDEVPEGIGLPSLLNSPPTGLDTPGVGSHTHVEVPAQPLPLILSEPLSPQPQPELQHPLLARLAHVDHRYDDLQRAFHDCHFSLEGLRKLLATSPSSHRVPPEALKMALERLNDYIEDARVELEIRIADESLLARGYETLLSVPGALASPASSAANGLDTLVRSDIELQIEEFVSGTEPSIQKVHDMLTSKLSDVQHDIAVLKRAIHGQEDPVAASSIYPDRSPSLSSLSPLLGPVPASAPIIGEQNGGWSSWIRRTPSRPSSPVPPTFGNIMTSPQLRHSPSLNFSGGSGRGATRKPYLFNGEMNEKDPLASLGFRVPMPLYVLPQASVHPSPRSRTLSTMYMVGLGARTASGSFTSLLSPPQKIEESVSTTAGVDSVEDDVE